MSFFVLDPGKTCGWAFVGIERDSVRIGTVPLEGLPAMLFSQATLAGQSLREASEIICESYSLRPHQAKQQSGSTMPAPEAIGVLRGVAYCIGAPAPRMVPPGCKSAGKAWAAAKHPALVAIRAELRSDHERDVIDIAAFVLREQATANRKASS